MYIYIYIYIYTYIYIFKTTKKTTNLESLKVLVQCSRRKDVIKMRNVGKILMVSILVIKKGLIKMINNKQSIKKVT